MTIFSIAALVSF